MKPTQQTHHPRWHKPLEITIELTILIPFCYLAYYFMDLHTHFMSFQVIAPAAIAIAIDELLKYKNI